MTSLTERLTGKGIGQVMEYKEESMHNVLTSTYNAVVSVAKKVKDNILCVMTAPVVTPPPTSLKTPEANLPGILLKVPNALVIK